MDAETRGLIRTETPVELFRTLVHDAAESRHARPTPDAEFYLVDLLSRSVRADTVLHDQTPLAETFLKAQSAGSHERDELLRMVGDRALFLSGVVPESLARRLVGVAYYAKVGRIAYAELAEEAGSRPSELGRQEVYAELADHFAEFVGILGEVSEHALGNARRCLLSACEKWLTTGSPAAWERLSRAGIIVPPGQFTRTVM